VRYRELTSDLEQTTLGPDVRLPSGTSVSLYADNEADALRKGTPHGVALQTATVDADGHYSFTDLQAGTEYQSYALVAGKNVWTSFIA
jgi:hypothetical protein